MRDAASGALFLVLLPRRETRILNQAPLTTKWLNPPWGLHTNLHNILRPWPLLLQLKVRVTH